MLAPHERRLLISICAILATGAAADWMALHRPREAAWLVGAKRLADLRAAGETGGPAAPEPIPVGTDSASGAKPPPRRVKAVRRSAVYDPAGRLELNAADSVEMVALTGVGPSLAGRILAERRRRGRFGSIEELMKVKGIGPKTLDRLRPQLFLAATKDSGSGGR